MPADHTRLAVLLVVEGDHPVVVFGNGVIDDLRLLDHLDLLIDVDDSSSTAGRSTGRVVLSSSGSLPQLE